MAVLAVGALGQAERTAAPWQRILVRFGQQARIAQGMAKLGRVLEWLAGIARGQRGQPNLTARRQYPANRLGRCADGIDDVFQLQLDIDRREQVVTHQQRLASRVLVGFQFDLGVELFHHAVTEDENLRARRSLIAVGHDPIGVGVFVDGQGQRRRSQQRQPEQHKNAPQHNGSFSSGYSVRAGRLAVPKNLCEPPTVGV